ncbi:hypothetical protein [Arthrobacter alpinus]|nr:hypothetical protein [Arthrobacter alpinus]
MSHILSGETSIVAGPNANGFLLDGGATSTDTNYFPERFMVLREGAKNITVQNYRLQGFYYYANLTALFLFNAQNNTPIENVTIDNVKITYPTGTTCNSSNGSGCQTDIIQFYPRSQSSVLNGFTFTNSSVSNLTSRDGLAFSRGTAATSVRASNINISNNSFINMQGSGTGANNAFITLPYGPLAGSNRISGNEFVRATSGQTYAVAWNGNTTSGSAGELSIEDNYFDGYSFTSVYLINTGDVKVQKNTFGARSASQTRPGTAEETRDRTSLLLDNDFNANGLVNTWFPAANAQVLAGAMPAQTIPTVSSLSPETSTCVATLDVLAPTTAPLPASTVDLDVYWTADRTAEVYLGRAEAVTGTGAKLALNLPVGPQSFPTTEVGGSHNVTIVNEDTGAASGYLRVQTIAHGSKQSSQYSRLVGFSGNCRPELTINQAADQNDPTVARDLHYKIVSSLPLNPESVTAAVVGVSAVGTAATIDAARLNPRSVSVTPIEGSANREFDVVARVDDSAVVTATVAAGKVIGSGGLTNRASATSTDNNVTFSNPVSVKPDSFTLVKGEPSGKDFFFQLGAGAPSPSSELRFASTVDTAGVQIGVKLSTGDSVIGAGETTSGKVRATASAGDVPANTKAVVSHALSSDDVNYDGLVVRSVQVKLFSTDPSIQITKRAFVEVSDSSTPERIMATGDEALSGTRLTDGQSVCFVYTVKNISSDDWATALTDVAVTDSDTRLGTNGVIGSIGALPIGQSSMLSACGALIPGDTTVGGGK